MPRPKPGGGWKPGGGIPGIPGMPGGKAPGATNDIFSSGKRVELSVGLRAKPGGAKLTGPPLANAGSGADGAQLACSPLLSIARYEQTHRQA